MRCKALFINLVATFVTIFTIAPNALAAENVTTLLQTAQALKGTPYSFGGSTTSGFDCSGFTSHVFSESGVELPRTSDSQFQVGEKVYKNDLKEGDLVFFNTDGSGISHVGIFMGDGTFIHSATDKGVIVTDFNDPYYWAERYVGAKRILDEETEQQEVAMSAVTLTEEETE
ncbi:C40 family peptidase [Bacillus solimangrovi]|uniref:NlpC/P60 domain-containing protein n=1 Tax=Bacillus solimangrovi TaxID=1305675 RepID=A0A1E5LH22_9BACI|nr:C40 family peptidase [Bacillus solimangrovi]OEH93346.1 hypothetical protein BFG57_12550 [Bacillus solimangrovi]